MFSDGLFYSKQRLTAKGLHNHSSALNPTAICRTAGLTVLLSLWSLSRLLRRTPLCKISSAGATPHSATLPTRKWRPAESLDRGSQLSHKDWVGTSWKPASLDS